MCYTYIDKFSISDVIMLKIDNKELKVIKKEIRVNNYTLNWKKGYEILIQLKFLNNKKTGYLNLSVGFEQNNNIISFLNREYKGIPYNGSYSKINMFEVYDTTKFLDTEIESEIAIKLGDIVNDKIRTCIKLKDELIKIDFDGYLDKRGWV